MAEAIDNAHGGCTDDEAVLQWFETQDLAQCLVTHAMAQGILRMRQQQNGRKRRYTKRQKDVKARLTDLRSRQANPEDELFDPDPDPRDTMQTLGLEPRG
jgi:hypothetical protein